jgi:alginate O-acetyltransferase complex protein AlgI
MLFNSIHFLIFFPIVLILFWSMPHKHRWKLLLAASYYFYGCFNVWYVALIAASTLVSYQTALWMEPENDSKKRWRYLLLSLVVNLGLLFAFKYLDFTIETFNLALSGLDFSEIPLSGIVLPIGISFYTFQVLSYSVDVYFGKRKAEKHLGIYALYVSFFPQLVAGPIERSTRLLPQFFEKKEFDYDRVIAGFKQVLWGFFKKIVIADRLAVYVNLVYDVPTDYSGMQIALATVFFTFQIYCDFSAYSDIAIGTAKMMGYDLMQNFNRPFISKSLSEFWRRWHISLYTWFTDYVFTPVMMLKRKWGKGAIIYAIAITFLLTGIWHGAKWTFILWGVLHGAALIYETLTQKTRKKWSQSIPKLLYNPLSIFLTFTFIVLVSVFFRVATFSDGIHIIQQIITFKLDLGSKLNIGEFGMFSIAISMGMIGLMLFKEYYDDRKWQWIGKGMFNDIVYAVGVLMLIVMFGVFEPQEFIYFQF